MNDLSVTFIQTELFWEDRKKNLLHLSEKIASIAQPTDLILLPEMFSSSFTMNTALVADSMDGECVNWMKSEAKQKQSVIGGSIVIKEGEAFYNRFLWVSPDGEIAHYDKRHLFRMAEENKYFTAGRTNTLVKLKGWKIGLQICYDLRFPVWSRRVETDEAYNYDVLLYVANWPKPRGHAWKTLLMSRAIENQSYVIGVNRIGEDGHGISYSGDSAAINFLGEKMSAAPENKESIQNISLSYSALVDFRNNFPAAMDADTFKIL
jgi:omega-amidase